MVLLDLEVKVHLVNSVQMGDAAAVANAIMTCGYEFDHGKMMYNYYKSDDTTEYRLCLRR